MWFKPKTFGDLLLGGAALLTVFMIFVLLNLAAIVCWGFDSLINYAKRMLDVKQQTPTSER